MLKKTGVEACSSDLLARNDGISVCFVSAQLKTKISKVKNGALCPTKRLSLCCRDQFDVT